MSTPFNPYWLQHGAAVPVDIETTAALLAEIKAMLQAISDPENQPSQFGTVTLEHMEREIAAEREACAQFLESTNLGGLPDATALHYARLLKSFADGIRARGQA